MISRAVKALIPFEYRADFGPQAHLTEPANEPARVSFTGEEIAALIAQVRAETLAEVARTKQAAESERLAGVTVELKRALGDLVQLASLVEAAVHESAVDEKIRERIEAIAVRLIQGQGDLFAAASAGQEGTV